MLPVKNNENYAGSYRSVSESLSRGSGYAAAASEHGS
jgi:hypothetical protein